MAAQSKNPLTPLMLASAAGNIAHVSDLLEDGVDVNARGPRNSTALMFAVGGGHLEVVRELVKHGADVEACEEGGWTALEHAREDGETEIVEVLEVARSRWLSSSKRTHGQPHSPRAQKRSSEHMS